MMIYMFTLLVLLSTGTVKPEKVSFLSTDSLQITADAYIVHDLSVPLIVLFHQAGWSRGEYREIAPKLNARGFNCLAVDLRSGEQVNGVQNETAARAAKSGKFITYFDALPDLIAALKFARINYATGSVIGWGSSYSASLVLKVAGDYTELMDGALAFAPGEYFGKFTKSASWIQDSAQQINIPIFITSARAEKKQWQKIFEAIPEGKKSSFLPETKGNHGSRALWDQFGDNPAYWKAVDEFLQQFLN